MSEERTNTSYLKLTQGKVNREDLFSIIYYATVDPFLEGNWASVLGEKTFVNWLRLLTLVDRSDAAPIKYGNDMTVPRSLESLAKLLGMSKPTLYKQVIKPLWNYGLIDLEEWQEQKKIGTKALNIVVFLYPKNDPSLKGKPLVKVRDYDTQYHSKAKSFAQKRSPKSNTNAPAPDFEAELAADVESPSHIQTNGAPFEGDIFLQLRHKVKRQHLITLEFLNLNKMPIDLIEATLEYLKPIEYEFSVEELTIQLDYMKDLLLQGESIFDFPKFFVTGLVRRRENKDHITYSPVQQLDFNELQQVTAPHKRVPFYNWLEERE